MCGLSTEVIKDFSHFHACHPFFFLLEISGKDNDVNCATPTSRRNSPAKKKASYPNTRNKEEEEEKKKNRARISRGRHTNFASLKTRIDFRAEAAIPSARQSRTNLAHDVRTVFLLRYSRAILLLFAMAHVQSNESESRHLREAKSRSNVAFMELQLKSVEKHSWVKSHPKFGQHDQCRLDLDLVLHL